MAIKKFNSIDGFSVGSDTPIAVIDNVANVSANSLLVSNLSNLGNVGNITITGGSAGFVLQTDGTGNLTFVDPTSTGVAGSNTQVQFNNNNSFGASSNFTFNSASNTLSVTNLSVTTNSNSSNVYTTNVYSSNYYSPIGDLNLYAGSGNSSISLTTTGNGTIDVNDTRITSLATPQFDNDAATKKYVDDVAQGLNIHDSCKVATTANIATLSGGTVAYNNGASGVGANLVITGGSITTIDTYSLQNLDRILVKNEANLTWNGIYTWATGGTVLTRATDFDTPAEIEGGDFTFVTEGNVYQNTGWVQTDNVTAIGTDSIEWQQFSGAGTYEAGNGLSLTGTVFSVNVDNATIEINSDVLRVKANAHLITPDIDSATGNSLTLSDSGYIQAGNLVTANYFTGTLTTASQPNITSLGNLINLSVTGSATIGGNTTIVGNANVNGNITGTNYVVANYFTGIITTTHQPNIESVGNLVGLTVSNVTGVVNFNTTANVSLGNISNLHILGGGSGYVLKTDGSGNLSWGVDSTNVAGSNGDVQFNDNGSLGANSNFNFDKATSVLTLTGNLITSNANLGNSAVANYFTGTLTTTAQPNITSLGTLTGLTVDGLTDLSDVSNLTITGGTAGYVLTTNGYGNLSWEPGGNVGPGFVSIRKDNFVGNGVQTQFSLSAVPSGEDAVEVNLNGLIQQGYVYNIVGSNVVFTSPPSSGANIEVTTFGALAIDQTDTQILFINGSSLVGSNNFTFTESNNTLTVNNVSSIANVSAGNVKSDNLLYANGSPYIFTTSASGSNTQVQFNDNNSFAGSANFTFDKGTNTLSVTNIVANGSSITYITGSNVFGNVNSAIQSHYANIANSVSGSNVTGQVGNALIAGTVYTNAQPNITSVGTLSNLNVTGTITAGNANIGSGSGGSLTGANLVSANYFIGDGSLLTNINAGNITGAYSNANVANYLPTYTGNVSANYFIGNGATLTYITGANVIGNVTFAITSNWSNVANSVSGSNVSGQVGNALIAGTVYTNAQPNITSLGTLSNLTVAGDTTITGNLTVSGNTNYINVDTLVVQDPIIEMGGGANGAPLTTNDGKDRGSLLHYYTTAPVDAFMGWDNSNGEFAFGSNVSVINEVVTINTLGNIRAGYFIGNGALLTGLPTQYANSNVANYLPTYTGNVSANYFIGDGSLLTNINAGNITGAYSNANVANYLPTYTGNISANYFIGNGSTLSNLTGANVSGNVEIAVQSHYANIANSIAGSNVTGQVGNALIAGTVYTNAQPNITSVGTLTSLAVTANITAGNAIVGSGVGGSITGANLVSANYFAGDGSLLTNINAANITGSYSNANVANYLPTYTGNVSANYFIGNGSTLTNITGSNVIGNVTFAITSNWANTANSISGANVSGNVNSAIQSQYANIANSIAGSNVTGQVGNALIAGTVYTNAQPNITSVGTLSNLTVSGDATITGNLTVSGNTNYINVDTLVVQDPIIEMGGGANGAPLTTNDGKDRGSLMHYYTTAPVDAFMGWDNSNAEFAFGSNVSVTNEVVTFNTLGNVRANYFIGDGSRLTNINISNIAGSYSNANVANYLPTYTGNISANYFIGNGSTLTNITGSNVIGNVTSAIQAHYANIANSVSGSNVSGQVGNALVAGTVYTNAQPNITSLGTLTSLSVTGNVSANYFIGDGSQLTGLPAQYANSNVANYLPTYTGNVSANYFIGNGSTLTNITGANVTGYVSNANLANTATVAGTVTTNAQPNITSVGTLSSLTVTGTITAGNANIGSGSGGSLTGANLISANYFAGDGSLLTNINASNITGSYSNANVANYLPTYTGNISANYFIGNGSTLTDITGSNVIGNVTFAITSNWSNVANSVSGSNVSGTVANATYALSAGTVTTNAQPNITSIGTLTGLTVNGLTDLGPIGNITITGGTSGYVLTTNGSGDLSWQAAGGSTGPGFVNITKNSFTGNGVQTVFTLTTTPASEASLLVNIDGITQQDAAYSLSGTNVTFASAPLSGEIVEIASYGSISIGSNTTVLFNDNGDIGNISAFSFNKYSNTLSVTNIDTTSITFGTGVVTVSGANAGIFSSGIDNINLGLGANVTVGSTSGNTTIQGNLVAGNVNISSNLSITGTATISNIKVNDLYSNRTPVSVTVNTIVDSFPVNRYRSAKYTMRVNSDDGYQAVEVLLIHDGSDSYVTIYGSLSTIGTDIVTLSSNILSGNVRLLATSGSANTTVNLLGTYVAD